MIIPFENMPDYSRIWVYQTNKNLTKGEVEIIQYALNEHISQWQAHGAPLSGAYKILYNRFVIIAVDEAYNATSGCSIDASTNWLKTIGLQLNIDFFDRSIAFHCQNEIQTIDFLKIKNAIAEGIILPETTLFNNLVTTKADFNNKWEIEAGDSWLKKYFGSVPV